MYSRVPYLNIYGCLLFEKKSLPYEARDEIFDTCIHSCCYQG